MRLIGTLDDERRALLFSNFLNRKGISHQLEVQTNTDWGSPDYGSSKCYLWIEDEDQVDEATKWYDLFLTNPHDPQFDRVRTEKPFLTVPEKPRPATSFPSPPPLPPFQEQQGRSPIAGWERQPMGIVTRLLLLGCCLLFFVAQLLTPITDVPANVPASPLFFSPIEKAILYDYPHTYELVDRLIKLYGYEALQDTSDLPPAGRYLVQEINQTPYWQGFYGVIQKQGFKALFQWTFDVPMFEKIRQGEVWRLFSPAVFHADLFHLFFNMLWLIVLGKQIEQRTGPWRYMLFILFVGVITNTAQYLMSGPNFVGLSGVLSAMLTFIWMRQYHAPWEGYQLDLTTIIFMLLFIGSMALIQFFSFFVEKSFDISFSTGIANVAHLTGVLLGLILGKLHFFSWRHA